jgi:hypothetical protein
MNIGKLNSYFLIGTIGTEAQSFDLPGFSHPASSKAERDGIRTTGTTD